jgi:hypothetical protein
MLHCTIQSTNQTNLIVVSTRKIQEHVRFINMKLHLSVGSNEHVRFINMKLQNNDDVRTMFSILTQFVKNQH